MRCAGVAVELIRIRIGIDLLSDLSVITFLFFCIIVRREFGAGGERTAHRARKKWDGPRNDRAATAAGFAQLVHDRDLDAAWSMSALWSR